MFIPMWGLPISSFVFWNENMGPIDNDVNQGMCCSTLFHRNINFDAPPPLFFSVESFLGGPPKAINWYTRTFYAYHNKYLIRSSIARPCYETSFLSETSKSKQSTCRLKGKVYLHLLQRCRCLASLPMQ